MKLTEYIHNIIKGTDIIKTTKFLNFSDFWSKEQLEEFQLQKLKKLIEFSYNNTVYYRQTFDKIGLKPSDIKTIEDIKKIPILSKEIIRKEYKNIIPTDLDISSRKIKVGKTGGTTGIPLRLYKNTQTRDFSIGSYRRWYAWMGIKPNDREVVLWGAKTVLTQSGLKRLQTKVIDFIDGRLTLNSFEFNEESLPMVAKKIIGHKPALLRGYLSAILMIAKYFQDNNLCIPSLKAISTTTETLLPIYRDYIEKVFKVKIYDQYGCGECNGIAYECSSHEGLHITEEHCIIETIDANGNICSEEVGDLIMTDLDNYAMPFIRYKNGDKAIISKNICSCGRNSKLLKEISGRSKDVIFLKDGSEVHGVFFTDIFYELGYDDFKYFTRFQIYQSVKGDFSCRLEKTENQIPQEEFNCILNTLLRFGNNVKIEMVDKLENDESGKFRYIISKIEEK